MRNWELAHAALAAVTTLIFLYQCFSGAGDGDGGDAGAGGHEGGMSGTGLADFMSVRNFVAFFVGYGWVTSAALFSGFSRVASSICGAAAGLVFALSSLLLLKAFIRFQENGTLDVRSLAGKGASVYIAIAPGASAIGKVMVDTPSGRMELPARTMDEVELRPGKMIWITGSEGGVLWVTGEAGAKPRDAAPNSASGQG